MRHGRGILSVAQKTFALGGRQRAAEQKALDLIALIRQEILELRFGFDTFGDDRQVERVRQDDDGLRNGLLLAVLT